MQQQDGVIQKENRQRLFENTNKQRRHEAYLELLRNRHEYDDGCDEEEHNDDDADCYCE